MEDTLWKKKKERKKEKKEGGEQSLIKPEGSLRGSYTMMAGAINLKGLAFLFSSFFSTDTRT